MEETKDNTPITGTSVGKAASDKLEMLQNYAIIGAVKIARGAITFAEFSKQFAEHGYKLTQEQMKDIYAHSVAHYEQNFKKPLGRRAPVPERPESNFVTKLSPAPSYTDDTDPHNGVNAFDEREQAHPTDRTAEAVNKLRAQEVDAKANLQVYLSQIDVKDEQLRELAARLKAAQAGEATLRQSLLSNSRLIPVLSSIQRMILIAGTAVSGVIALLLKKPQRDIWMKVGGSSGFYDSVTDYPALLLKIGVVMGITFMLMWATYKKVEG